MDQRVVLGGGRLVCRLRTGMKRASSCLWLIPNRPHRFKNIKSSQAFVFDVNTEAFDASALRWTSGGRI